MSIIHSCRCTFSLKRFVFAHVFVKALRTNLPKVKDTHNNIRMDGTREKCLKFKTITETLGIMIIITRQTSKFRTSLKLKS